MSVSLIHTVCKDHIQSLSSNDFILFVDRLLNKFYPKVYSSTPIQLANVGYTIINDGLFSVLPEVSKLNATLKQIVPIVKKSASNLIIISKTPKEETLKISNTLKSKIRNNNSEVWDAEHISERVKLLSEDELIDILGKDSTISAYFQISQYESVSYNLYQEIFTEIIRNFTGPRKRKSLIKSDLSLKPILEKVPLNFANVQDGFWDMYASSYQFKEMAETFIQERYKSDDEFKMDLQAEIRSSFQRISGSARANYPVNDLNIIDQMAEKCLRPQFKEDPKLKFVARGIILYLFELCEFGAKNDQDLMRYKEPSLFEDSEEVAQC